MCKKTAPVLLCLLAAASLWTVAPAQAAPQQEAPTAIHHVLLLSIDGFHAIDLAKLIKTNPNSALGSLSRIGLFYTQASSSKPSDSFPGLLAITTGGTPRTTGVWYDVSYDRSLAPPGSNGQSLGTVVAFDESIDRDMSHLDAGGGIDPAKLPIDPAHNNAPVYPHSYLRVNTIFEVIKSAGLRTAWSDKHPAYEILNGPSGKGVDDLYSPEIAADDITGNEKETQAYDDIKVKAILNEIDGKDHSGTHSVGVPAIFGMNFQAVSVGQKLPGGGYTDNDGTPSAMLEDAVLHTDQSIGKMVSELEARGLMSSTLIIVTAKHGQAPIDPHKRRIIASSMIPNLVNGVRSGLLANQTADDIALLWLTDQNRTEDVVNQLRASSNPLAISQIFWGDSLKLMADDPQSDPRTPDVIVVPEVGVIYAGASASKIAEHGGFSHDDTNVALLVAHTGLQGRQIKTPAETTEIAPTILHFLGLDPQALQAVRIEHTPLLPGLSGGN